MHRIGRLEPKSFPVIPRCFGSIHRSSEQVTSGSCDISWVYSTEAWEFVAKYGDLPGHTALAKPVTIRFGNGGGVSASREIAVEIDRVDSACSAAGRAMLWCQWLEESGCRCGKTRRSA